MCAAITIGSSIINSKDGLYSLNDLHKAAGSADNHRPAQWLRTDSAKDLISELCKSAQLANSMQTRRGAQGGTYACRELVIAYAAWISAAFHLKVIRVFLNATTPSTISSSQKLAIRDAVNALHRKTGELHQAIYTRLYHRFAVSSYAELPVGDFDAALAFLGTAPRHAANPLPAAKPALAAPTNSGKLTKEQGKAIEERLSRLMAMFHPFSQQFADLNGIRRALKGNHTDWGTAMPAYRELI